MKTVDTYINNIPFWIESLKQKSKLATLTFCFNDSIQNMNLHNIPKMKLKLIQIISMSTENFGSGLTCGRRHF